MMRCTDSSALNNTAEKKCEQFIEYATNMFSGTKFMNQLGATPIPTDKVTRIVNNIGHQIISAIDTIGQKVVHYFHILHQIQSIKNVKN